ncbi:hypothetical protein DFS33DRAFT_1337768 [Desarmillaria ectypa]|nr:hypothetical protein DFS33DRAFT_1337768 [Desarmillaria ectypa]
MYSRRCNVSFNVAGQLSYDFTASPSVPSHDSFTATAAQSSPFIPPAALYHGTPSPYASNIPLPGGSLHISGHPFLNSPLGVHQRTNSFGGIGGQADTHGDHFYNTSLYDPYRQNQQLPSQLQINPWLSGYAQAGYLWFDLSMAAFNPMRVDNMDMQVPLGMNELKGPATHPHIQYITIICDAMPYWPITIGDGSGGLALGDVLQGLYCMMMWRIGRAEWQRFPEGDKAAIAKAFVRRCRALRNPQLENAERQDGVKRVDLLLGKTMFRGLVVEGGIFKLILS